jgi:3-oxoadipate enol-lactonase
MTEQTIRTTALSRARTRDGAEIAYRVIKGTGPGRIALVHSLAMDNSFWDRTASHLGQAGDVLVYDCRGHGGSAKGTGPYTGEQFAGDLADLLDAVGWDSAVVAGASMGGCVTLAFAALYPRRVQGVGLIDTTASYGPQAPAQWEERAQKAVTAGMAALVGFQKARWFSKAFAAENPDIEAAAIAVFLRNDVASYVETCRMLGRFDQRDALPRIAVPTRIVVGSEDLATPVALAEAMQRAIPAARLTVVPGAAHLTPMESPAVVANELRALMTTDRPSLDGAATRPA